MAPVIHLIVDKGEDRGKQITVPPEGGRMGRSSKNDIVLVDPMLSRHHCRLFFKTGDGLWITDLGSSNQTVVNNAPIQEVKLKVGDLIMIGDTVLRVLNDGQASAPAPQPAPPPSTPPPAAPSPSAPLPPSTPAFTRDPPRPKATAPVVDLGLASKGKPTGRKIPWGPITLIEIVVVAAVVWVFWPKISQHLNRPRPVATQPVAEETSALEVSYEKVLATPQNIFRYSLQIEKGGVISVRIDDLENNRHVRPKEKQMDKDYCDNLAKSIVAAGFFALEERYEGIQPDVQDSWDLTITVGRRTHRTVVMNRVEPDVFKTVREMIEECGSNELGLEAIQFSTDKLLSMAQDAYLLGRKLYDEREIKFANLAAAIKSLREADMYLETVEPKPDYYGELQTALVDYAKELDKRYGDQNFRVRKAVNLSDWEEAARELQMLLELVPDRADSRNKEARKKLLDVENRLKEKK